MQTFTTNLKHVFDILKEMFSKPWVETIVATKSQTLIKIATVVGLHLGQEISDDAQAYSLKGLGFAIAEIDSKLILTAIDRDARHWTRFSNALLIWPRTIEPKQSFQSLPASVCGPTSEISNKKFLKELVPRSGRGGGMIKINNNKKKKFSPNPLLGERRGAAIILV